MQVPGTCSGGGQVSYIFTPGKLGIMVPLQAAQVWCICRLGWGLEHKFLWMATVTNKQTTRCALSNPCDDDAMMHWCTCKPGQVCGNLRAELDPSGLSWTPEGPWR